MEVVTADLKERMGVLLEKVQATYPDAPAGDGDRWWLPVRLGGTAPTLEEAEAMDAADRAERAARRAARTEG